MHIRRNNEVQQTQRSILRQIREISAVLVLLVQVFLPVTPIFASEIASIEVPAPEENQPTTSDAEETTVIEVSEESSVTDVPLPHEEKEEQTLPEQIAPIEADLPATPESVTADSVSEAITLSEESVATAEEVVGGGLSDAEIDSNSTAINDPIDEVIDSESITPESEEIDTPNVPEDDLPLTEEEVPDISEEPETSDTETDEVIEPESATTTNVVQPELHTVTNDDNRYSFGVDDCVRVADGSFYCTEFEAETTESVTENVFVAPDADGDTEIFVQTDGDPVQITFNTIDDAAPFYDARTDTIVFHRLVEYRYQIVSIDLESGEETQLTFDSYNNMQPSRSGRLTVWQGWVGNDWEIFLMDDGEIVMLTDNTTDDIGPQINGEYVVWQSERGGTHVVQVYNTDTAEMEQIEGAEGTSVMNPRMVLVYDAEHRNGDTETLGYDLKTGKVTPLSVLPQSLPDELPDPDQTGEERALITSVTQLKTKTAEDDDGEMPPQPQDTTDTSTTTDGVEDLIIPAFEDSEVNDVVAGPAPQSQEIPDIDMSAAEPVMEPPVPDLVIPEFTEVNVSADSQGDVAEVR